MSTWGRVHRIMTDQAMNPQVAADATEFGIHFKQGGWRLGLLVARNVQVAKAGGDRQSKSITTGGNASGKVTGQAFAQVAGVSLETVRLHLKTWNLASDNGVVEPSDTLTSGQECPLPDSQSEWSRYYQMARQAEKPRQAKKATTKKAAAKKTAAKKTTTPTERGTPGAVVIGRMRSVQEMRDVHPDFNATQIGKALGVSHQEVGRMLWLADGPPRIREHVGSGRLKWSVAQEVLQAPLLDHQEMAGLADMFADGRLSQAGQPKVNVRPMVLLFQRITPAARTKVLAGEMTVAEAEASLKVDPKPEPKEGTPVVYAENLRKRVDTYKRAVEAFTDGLTQSEGMIPTIVAVDPVVSAHIAQELNLVRAELAKQHRMLDGWIVGLGGTVDLSLADVAPPKFQVVQGGVV